MLFQFESYSIERIEYLFIYSFLGPAGQVEIRSVRIRCASRLLQAARGCLKEVDVIAFLFDVESILHTCI